MLNRLLFFAAVCGFFAGCVTSRPKPPLVVPVPAPITRASALIRLEPAEFPLFDDDLDTASLRTAALQSLSYFKGMPDSQHYVLGKDSYTARDLSESMETLAALLENAAPGWPERVKESFNAYQSVGTDAQRTVIFSSYYEPSISARLTRDSVYRYPLYARPPDLVDVDLGLFDPAYQGARIAGRREGRALVPYSTRGQIDTHGVLKQKGLEIAWSNDAAEILDLQIEGSGWLDLGKGRAPVRIRYDGDNGRRYRSIGQYLITSGRIPAKSFNRRVFLRYLASHPKERQDLLNVNERYIFFRIDASTASPFAYGNIEAALTAGRSIATDPKLFPKGALAWISTAGVHRFVLNQDEGGAIQGPGRVDVFAGHGESAKEFATHLWNNGKLYFLVRKKN